MNGAAEQSIEVPKLGMGATSERFGQVATAHGYTVVAVGPNRFRVARVYRPSWAIVVAALTAVLCGLGLLFLLVKKTETGDAVVTEDRTGVKLRLTGALRPEFVGALRSAMTSWGSPATVANEVRAEPLVTFAPMTPMAPSVSQSAASERIGMQPAVSATVPRPSRPTRRTVELMLVFGDGQSIAVADGGVLGRDPTADPSLPKATLHAIPDPSLSKTHLSVGPATNAVWILDHHSTNGTSVVINGVVTLCAPGARVEVPVGSQILAGDLRMEVGSR